MLLVIISVPAIGLLFFQNKQVQTSIATFLSEKISKNIEAEVSLSSLKYSFFKRLYIYDLLIEDQLGDTLIYSEFTRIRIKKYKPEKLDIHIHSISLENFYFNIKTDDQRKNNLKFLTDRLKDTITPPEEKVVLKIDLIEIFNSHFSKTAVLGKQSPYGVDFTDLDVYDLEIRVENIISKMGSLYMDVVKVIGVEKSGFILENASFGLTIGKQFMTFSEGVIHTPDSKAIIPEVNFRFNNYQDFKQFHGSVDTYISSSNSFVTLPDLSYFFWQLEKMKGDIFLSGNVHGKFEDLIGEDIEISYMDSTQLNFDMELIGMQSPDSLFMLFDFKQFKSDFQSLKTLTSYYDLALFNDSVLTQDIGSFNYSGKFSGYVTDFETSGKLETDLGRLSFDLNMKPDTNRSLKYNGYLETSDFHIGKLLKQEEFVDNISLKINVDGTSKPGDINLLVSGKVDSLGVYGYNYQNLDFQGNIANKTFDGSFSIKDPNIDLNFSGKVDFAQNIPQLNFTVDVANLRPYYLNLRDDDPEYFASFLLKTNLSGIKLDQMNGEVQLVNSFFKRTGSQVQIYDFLVTARNDTDTSFISLESDLLNANIYGNYLMSHLPSTFKSIINNHLEIFPEETEVLDTICDFAYNITIKDANPILDFFFPEFRIAEGSTIYGYYKPGNNAYTFSLTGLLPYFEYNGFHMDVMSLSSSVDTSRFVLELEGEKLYSPGGFEIIQPIFTSTIHNDQTKFDIHWDNELSPRFSGDFIANGKLDYQSHEDYSYQLTIDPSWLYYNNNRFDIPTSTICVQAKSLSFDSLIIYGNEQYVLADGRYSDKEDDAITISLNNINLGSINDLSEKISIDAEGRLSGDIIVKSDHLKPIFISNLEVDSLYLNNYLFGYTSLAANWEEEKRELSLDLTSIRDSIKTIDVNGSMKPGSGLLDFNVSLYQLPLSILQPYLSDIFDEIEGSSTAQISVNGSLSKPMLNGNIYLQESILKLSDTQTRYSISDNIRIYKNNIFFEEFEVLDKFDNKLIINGNITNSNFQNFIFNLDLNADNFNFLGTRRNDNEQFYGDIFASAAATLRGPVEQLEIVVSALTEKFTNLNLPLFNASEIQSSDFITFKRPEEIEPEGINRATEAVRGLTLDMDLEIASGANVQLIFDPKVGDIIEASGRGNLKIKIDENGNFTMFGDVLIQDGEYLFTLQNVINKKFRVKSGGNIVWNGSPTKAIIDLQAIYELKAAPYNLSPDPDETMKKRITVHCLLSLEGDLSNPGIHPSIELPTAEPETRTLLENSIGTDEDLMRQFISLLVINNFMDVAGGISTGGVAAGVTASELMSNQLSNWLSQISNDFDIGVNYRPGDQITSDEVEVALSTQLFDDRIILSGNLDVGGNEINPGSPTTNIVGDFDLEFKVTDKISLKAFNRANDDFILTTAPYTQGVGLFYRSEFDKLSDLFKRKKKKNPVEENPVGLNNEGVLKEESEGEVK